MLFLYGVVDIVQNQQLYDLILLSFIEFDKNQPTNLMK